MVKKIIATEADRAAAARLALTGLARGEQLHDVLRTLRPDVECRFPFPGDVLTELAAAACISIPPAARRSTSHNERRRAVCAPAAEAERPVRR
jgi:hypothetical protein